MTSALMCMERYVRSEVTGNKHDVDLYCQYTHQHGTVSHSWQLLREEDMAVREAKEQQPPPVVPEQQHLPLDHPSTEKYAEMICESIEEGHLDLYLEVILSFGHDRKRTMRGVRGFGPHRFT
jgi:hypothetical protein